MRIRFKAGQRSGRDTSPNTGLSGASKHIGEAQCLCPAEKRRSNPQGHPMSHLLGWVSSKRRITRNADKNLGTSEPRPAAAGGRGEGRGCSGKRSGVSSKGYARSDHVTQPFLSQAIPQRRKTYAQVKFNLNVLGRIIHNSQKSRNDPNILK